MSTWRPMTEADLAAVAAIELVVHPQFPPEGAAIMGERLRLWPSGCSFLDLDGRPLGYLIGFPWRMGGLPPLGVMLGCLPKRPTCYFIHDLAILPEARGRGWGTPAVRAALAEADASGLTRQALVAVHGSSPFWQRFGFLERAEAGLAEAGFGADARYMVRRSAGR